MPQKHGLGSGNGRIVEYEDGTAGYIQSMSFTQAFRVKIAEVTGFSVEKSGKLLTRKFNVLGNGTLLGTAEVNHGTAEVIENWFRSPPLFGAHTAPSPAAAPSSSVADEIAKLGQLRSQGLLTQAEFEAQKARLLN
jgi:hypothetical protein